MQLVTRMGSNLLLVYQICYTIAIGAKEAATQAPPWCYTSE